MGVVEILRLRQAFSDEQSEALAQFIDANLATKKDIEELRLEIERVRAELRVDIEKTRADLAEKMLRYQVGGTISIGIFLVLFGIFGA